MTTTSGGTVFGAVSDIYRSTDRGMSWRIVYEQSALTSMVIATEEDVLYAATDEGIARSTDNGESWLPMRDGMDDPGTTVVASGPNGEIYAGTFGGTIYRLVTGSSDVDEPGTGAARLSLASTPNPFRGTSRITLSIPSTERARLDLLDARGTIVLTLFDEVRPAGASTATLDGAELPSGLYFLRLRCGPLTRTERIVLQR
jgi:hypothetical protein